MGDTVSIKADFLQAVKGEDEAHSNFVKAVEEHRRDRERRSEAGDETAKLKFGRTTQLASKPHHQAAQQQKFKPQQQKFGQFKRGQQQFQHVKQVKQVHFQKGKSQQKGKGNRQGVWVQRW